jgi:hypothetical protein
MWQIACTTPRVVQRMTLMWQIGAPAEERGTVGR